MKRLLRIVGVAALFGALILSVGCGGGDSAPVVTNPSQTTPPITATVNPNGTVTTPATPTVVATAPGTQGYLATVSVTLPASTVITAKNADGTTKQLTAAPSFTFTVPADSTPSHSGISGIPTPPAGFNLVSTAGEVNVQLTGAASATFNPPMNVTMSVPGRAVGDTITVYSIKDGSTEYRLLGDFTVATAGSLTFPVSDLCHHVGIKPEVISTSPVDTASNVPVTTKITATFNVPMNPNTINTQAFNITPFVNGTVTYDSTTNTATFTPQGLGNGVKYTAHITAVARGAASGNPAKPADWSFTTAVTGSTGGGGTGQ